MKSMVPVNQYMSLYSFSFGILLAETKRLSDHSLLLYFTFLVFILAGLYILPNRISVFYTTLNYFMIMLIAVLLLVITGHVRFPKWLESVSFDVYLVHNKVLVGLKALMTFVPFWLYVLFMLATVTVFYNVRRKLEI